MSVAPETRSTRGTVAELQPTDLMTTPTLWRRLLAAAFLLAISLAFFLPTASARIIDFERAQIVLLPILQPPKLAVNTPPEERVLRAGDLISIFLPDKAALKFVGVDGPSTAIVALDEARYRELSAQGGGHVPETGMPPVRGHGWKRFGAAKAGIVHLLIRQGGELTWLRFEIGAAPEFKYGSTVRRSDRDQSTPLSLTEFDQLVLDLPGELADGWSVGPEADSGLKLVALTQAADAAHRVSLTFTVIRREGAPPEQALVIKTPTTQFNYVWRRAGVALAS